MSILGTAISTGRQSVCDTVAKLLKSIDARVDAYCWHTNGHDEYKESSIAQLLGISTLEMVMILKNCECLDKETKEFAKNKGLEQLVLELQYRGVTM